MRDSNNLFSSAFKSIRRLGMLYVESAKLTLAEKITIFFATAAMVMIMMVLALTFLVFFLIGIAEMLATYIEPFWTYFIVAGVFALAIVLIYVFRYRLLFDPIAHFVSRLILNPPKDKKDEK